MTLSTHSGSEVSDIEEGGGRGGGGEKLTAEEERQIFRAASRVSIVDGGVERSYNSSSRISRISNESGTSNIMVKDEHASVQLSQHKKRLLEQQLQQQVEFEDSESTSPPRNNNVDGFFNAKFFKTSRLFKASLLGCWGIFTLIATSTLMVLGNANAYIGWYALVMVVLYGINVSCFVVYDKAMMKRFQPTIRAAQRTSQVVNSLFPANPNIRDRLLQASTNRVDEDDEESSSSMEEQPVTTNTSKMVDGDYEDKDVVSSFIPEPPKEKLKTFLQRSESGMIDIVGNSNNSVGSSGNPSLGEIGVWTNNNKKGRKLKSSKPIADFFPNTTVMFANISGFTAWSSEREPVQVFCLLETLFVEFDKLTSLHNVFKVETIGDCYVAVTGLPEPSKDHAVRLTKFAADCILVMHSTCQKLEAQLGPGTADLSLRVGLHSGSVTAGVLRGQKLRFQLFGDTVNTASRMEMYSKDNCIQCSQSTADLLLAANKKSWLTSRDDPIPMKGKGNLQTYWLRPTRKLPSIDNPRSSFMLRAGSISKGMLTMDDSGSSLAATRHMSQTNAKDWGNTSVDCFVPGTKKEAHLVDWNVQILLESLEKVVVRRQALLAEGPPERIRSSSNSTQYRDLGDISPFKEVTEIIELSEFHPTMQNNDVALQDEDVISPEVRFQLHHFVSSIAQMYQDVPFHNLEHASHVTMSAAKLMNRIVTPDCFSSSSEGDTDPLKVAELIHHSTFGIATDPLAQFAIIFSALIHDVEHTGLTNKELVEEGSPLSITYDGVSVAEQNSVAIAWNLLMKPDYDELRNAMFSTPNERYRFRQLVVNTVMATDIIDKELQALRKNRWKKAFHDPQLQSANNNNSTSDTNHSTNNSTSSTSNTRLDTDAMNRKATIVIEHIIQASDVAHTMQHWHIYCKWNEKFFVERYRAYLNGHCEEDPSLRWYENEMGFFDHYIIPLAYKLKECGVFGVSCDEYLGFALENRLEWEMKGVSVVSGMKERVLQQHNHKRRLLTPQQSVDDLSTDVATNASDDGGTLSNNSSHHNNNSTSSTTTTELKMNGDVSSSSAPEPTTMES